MNARPTAAGVRRTGGAWGVLGGGVDGDVRHQSAEPVRGGGGGAERGGGRGDVCAGEVSGGGWDSVRRIFPELRWSPELRCTRKCVA